MSRLSDERIMELAEISPIWYAIPQGREKYLLTAFARRIEREAYKQGQERMRERAASQAAWNRRESGQVEPVAWMHNLPGRVDVIHTEVKNLLARQAVESHQGFHRPLDKTEHYTIPLYDHAKPCERCKELEEQVHFQSCLTRDLLPYQDEAVKGRDKLAALEAENARLRAREQAQKAVNNGVYLDKLATLEAELSGLRARYLRMESEDAATISQQAERIKELEAEKAGGKYD